MCLEDDDDNDEARGYQKLFGEPAIFKMPIRHLVRDVQ